MASVHCSAPAASEQFCKHPACPTPPQRPAVRPDPTLPWNVRVFDSTIMIRERVLDASEGTRVASFLGELFCATPPSRRAVRPDPTCLLYVRIRTRQVPLLEKKSWFFLGPIVLSCNSAAHLCPATPPRGEPPRTDLPEVCLCVLLDRLCLNNYALHFLVLVGKWPSLFGPLQNHALPECFFLDMPCM